MDKDFLEKHINDPAWAEVIRLYSGLFDTQDERETFILDVANEDILLAAECKTSSVEEERKIGKNISITSEKWANNVANPEISVQGFLALMELEKADKILKVLQNVTVKKRHIKTVSEKKRRIETVKRKRIKVIIKKMITETNTNKSLDILEMIWNLPIKKKDLKELAIKSFNKEITNEIHKNRIEKLIEKVVMNRNELYLHSLLANTWIKEYQLQDKFPIENLIKKLIQNGDNSSLQIARNWFEKYRLQDKFLIEKLIERLIQNGDNNSLVLARTWIEKYQLQDRFPIENLIKELIQHGHNNSLGLARNWIEKYQLQTEFPFKNLIEKLIQKGDNDSLLLASTLYIQEKRYEVIKTKIIRIDNIVECEISNVIPLEFL